MGCCVSLPSTSDGAGGRGSFRAPYNAVQTVKKVTRPRWKAEKPMTQEELERRRAEFFDTEQHFGGNRVIWDTIKAASETDLENGVLMFEAAGVIVANETMTLLYYETGVLYSIPDYVYSAPSNLVKRRPTPSSSTGLGVSGDSNATGGWLGE